MSAARTLLLAVGFAAALAPSAHAAVPHTVQPGETLWGIASANNFTTRSVAVFNGLSEDSHVIAGTTVNIPSLTEGASALQQAGIVPAAAPASASAAAPSGAPAPMGAYTVRPGDTLAALAAVAGVPMASIAAMNGLDPNGILLAGTVLKLPTGSPAPPRASEAAPAPVVPQAAPAATPGRVTAAEIAQIAAAHGVSPSLASAIAWQESGFNNAMVSAANARGVMQVMPGTWSYIQDTLTSHQLNPNSPHDNVHAGVMYLRRLIDLTGDESTAIAGYYQGLASVQSRGMFDDTQRYVANVQALRSRFGG
jgi:soluble lytic murein transglycosylase-like protein